MTSELNVPSAPAAAATSKKTARTSSAPGATVAENSFGRVLRDLANGRASIDGVSTDAGSIDFHRQSVERSGRDLATDGKPIEDPSAALVAAMQMLGAPLPCAESSAAGTAVEPPALNASAQVEERPSRALQIRGSSEDLSLPLAEPLGRGSIANASEPLNTNHAVTEHRKIIQSALSQAAAFDVGTRSSTKQLPTSGPLPDSRQSRAIAAPDTTASTVRVEMLPTTQESEAHFLDATRGGTVTLETAPGSQPIRARASPSKVSDADEYETVGQPLRLDSAQMKSPLLALGQLVGVAGPLNWKSGGETPADSANTHGDSSTPMAGMQTLAPQVTTQPPTAATISPPVTSPQWAAAFSSAVLRMTSEQISEATLTMSPNELGTISIKIGLDGNTVSVGFTADSTEVRQAVNASLPVLQEMLAQAGLSLGHSSVSQENAREPAPFLRPQPTSSSPSASEARAAVAPPPQRRPSIRGGIDLFA